MSFISPKSLALVNATKGVVAENALKITSAFYPKMFSNNPEVMRYFNESNQLGGAQPRALADSIIAYAVNIERLENLGDDVQRIIHKHCALNVQAADYQIVHDNLMAAIAEVLGDAVTPEIGAAWSEAVMALGKLLIKAEGDLYQKAAAATGGWNGLRQFHIISKKVEADGIVSISLRPVDGQPIMLHEPGQYLTVSVNPLGKQYFAPRHYTITSRPGDEAYRVTVKALTDGDHHGIVSTYVVEKLQVGDVVNLFPPFGPAALRGNPKKPAVFVSAGVGITPWATLIPAALNRGQKVILFHADSSSKTHALRHEIESALGPDAAINYSYSHPIDGDEKLQHFSKGRLDVAKIKHVLDNKGLHVSDVDFFLSMKPLSSVSMASQLKKEGAMDSSIFANEFGPHMHH